MFITLALEDGADPHLIETRVPHTKKRRSTFDGYNRGLQWERTCAEVAKLKIVRRPAGRGEVIALPLAAGGPLCFWSCAEMWRRLSTITYYAHVTSNRARNSVEDRCQILPNSTAYDSMLTPLDPAV